MVLRTLCVLLCCASAETALQAHHSYAAYFRDRSASIEGTIEQLTVGNPHAVLELRTADGTLITAEWGSAVQLARTGFAAGMLSVGDHVIVTGSPARDPDAHRLALVSEIRRPRDGWRWSKSGGVSVPSPATR